jgi:hypothetical protein
MMVMMMMILEWRMTPGPTDLQRRMMLLTSSRVVIVVVAVVVGAPMV